MITREQLEQLKNIDIRTVNKSTLVDIRSVPIDESAELDQRAQQFIAQIKNPYLFRVGDSAVKMSFGDDRQIASALRDYLSSLYAGH